MVEDLTKKGTEGASATGAVIDLSPATLKAVPKAATNTLVAVGISVLTTIAGFAARSLIDKAIAAKAAKDLAEGKEVKPINPDLVDGAMIASGVGLAAMSKNTYMRAACVGIATGGVVSMVVRKYPRVSSPFAKSIVLTKEVEF